MCVAPNCCVALAADPAAVVTKTITLEHIQRQERRIGVHAVIAEYRPYRPRTTIDYEVCGYTSPSVRGEGRLLDPACAGAAPNIAMVDSSRTTTNRVPARRRSIPRPPRARRPHYVVPDGSLRTHHSSDALLKPGKEPANFPANSVEPHARSATCRRVSPSETEHAATLTLGAGARPSCYSPTARAHSSWRHDPIDQGSVQGSGSCSLHVGLPWPGRWLSNPPEAIGQSG